MNTTKNNHFGESFSIGQKMLLQRRFGNMQEEVTITEILPSGKFFKVDKSNHTFSILTLHSKGSTITNGYYLTKI